MGVADHLRVLVGDWAGSYSLWLNPLKPARVSHTTAKIDLPVNERFLRVEYTWSYEGEVQSGCLLVTCLQPGERAEAVWFDSWHMGEQFMVCRGFLTPQGDIDVSGLYATSSSPDWGWRTVIEVQDHGRLRIWMDNLSPNGHASRAVEAEYSRGM